MLFTDIGDVAYPHPNNCICIVLDLKPIAIMCDDMPVMPHGPGCTAAGHGK
jgi:hypothetical protein